MLFRNNIRASGIFITFIGVDRLLAVVFPLRSRHLRTTTNTWRACGLVWISLVAVNIPESLFFLPLVPLQSNYLLYFPWQDAARQSCRLAVNVISTSMVSWKLRQLSASEYMTNKINVMLIFAVNLLMFVIFFLPVSLAWIVDSHDATMHPTVCLTSVNCCFDPLLYYFSLDSFWKKKANSGSSSLKHQVSKSDLRGGETSGMK